MWITPKTADQALRAEVRGVEYGHHVMVQPNGSFRVRRASIDAEQTHHEVSYAALGMQYIVGFQCSCPAGLNGKLCWAMAAVGRRLEREGIAVWDNGRWYATEQGLTRAREAAAQAQPADPFEGLDNAAY